MHRGWKNYNQYRWLEMLSRLAKADAAIAVGLALWEYTDETAQCYPKFSTLAKHTQRDERSVRRAVKVLEDAGFIRVVRGNGRGLSSEFELTLPVKKADRIVPLRPAKRGTRQSAKGDRSVNPYKKDKHRHEHLGRASGERPRENDRHVIEDARPHLIERWKDWLSLQGLPAEKLEGLIRGDQIELPCALPPESGHWRERHCREWIVRRFEMRATQQTCSA